MSVEVPHLAQPFSFTSAGVAKTVEQNSIADVQDCVLRVCLCPEGFREDEPEFGIPPLEFTAVPLQVAGVEEAVERWEPRATVEITEAALEAANQASRVVNIEVSP